MTIFSWLSGIFLSIGQAYQAPVSYSHHNTLGMTPPLTTDTSKSHTHVYKSHP